MKTVIECISCKVRQAVDVVKRCTDDSVLQEKTLKKMLEIIISLSFDRAPVAIRRDCENVVKEVLGIEDPYQVHKDFCNKIGGMLYPELKKIVKESPNPLKTAIQLAVTGNIIDFGMFKLDEVTEEKIRETIDRAMNTPATVDDSEKLIERIHNARDIWIVADNTGELFFDRVLIEELPPEKVTVVVRGMPILNDATMSDAEITGLTKMVRVIDDGYDAPALIPDECDPRVRDDFFKADLVISKGQGNYESLSEIGREIFFLLMVKCEMVANDISCKVGEAVIKRGGLI